MIVATTVSLWLASVAFSERNEKGEALQEAVRLREEANAARSEIAQFAASMKDANVLVTSGRAHADAQRWAAAYADFSAAIERQPNYYNAWTERASLEVKLGLWKQAAEDYSRSIELGVPVDNPANWGIPQLFLFNGDTNSHREYCLTMLEQAEQQNQPPSMALIRSCVMAIEPVGDPEALADQAIELLEASDDDRHGVLPLPGPPREPPSGPPPRMRQNGQQPQGAPPGRNFGLVHYPRGAGLYTTGVALFRAGRYDEAIAHLQEALSDDRWRASSIVYPALAMACHRNGDADQAREAFAASEQEIDAWTLAMQQGPTGSMPIPWFDWIEALLLHREASILLTGFAPADDPRLRDVQERGRRLIEDGSR